MKTAAVAKLKAKLSEYLDVVEAGEDVRITRNGRTVARIIKDRDPVDQDARTARLIRKGVIRPGKGPIPLDLIKNLPIGNVTREDILRIMDEEREDRI
jgi:prevent-host-death family protein